MEVVLHGCQLSPDDDGEMHYAATLEQCIRSTEDLLSELRRDPSTDAAHLAARAVYELTVRLPDAATLISILNRDGEAIKRCIVARKLVRFVTGGTAAQSKDGDSPP